MHAFDWLAPWFPTGWIPYLGGGVVIGLGVGLLFVLTGLIGGISTTYTAIWSFFSDWPHFQQPRFVTTRNWRLAYALGLIAGATLYTFAANQGHGFVTGVPAWQLLLGGIVGGFGARMGGGCTSGHGICGLASLQLPSLVAVLTFLTTGIATAHLVHALGGY